MTEIDAKTLKSFCNEIEKLWWIENPSFRQKYNAYISAALLKGYETGDFSWITRILKATPDENLRLLLLGKMQRFLPLSYRGMSQAIVKDKARWEKYNLNDFIKFKGIEIKDFFRSKDDLVVIEKIKLEPSEFVDFILDTITFNRNHFSFNDLEKISETLELIKNRLEKAKEQTVKKA